MAGDVKLFYVEDDNVGTIGKFPTLQAALDQANHELAEYRKNADEGWGVDTGGLCVLMADADIEDCREGECMARCVESNVRYHDEDGEPFSGFDYVCDMAMELTPAGLAALTRSQP